MRLLTWVEGPMMIDGKVSPDLMEKVGAYLGRMHLALGSFYDKALLRGHTWWVKPSLAIYL